MDFRFERPWPAALMPDLRAIVAAQVAGSSAFGETFAIKI